jgi:hypothetical protein
MHSIKLKIDIAIIVVISINYQNINQTIDNSMIKKEEKIVENINLNLLL